MKTFICEFNLFHVDGILTYAKQSQKDTPFYCVIHYDDEYHMMLQIFENSRLLWVHAEQTIVSMRQSIANLRVCMRCDNRAVWGQVSTRSIYRHKEGCFRCAVTENVKDDVELLDCMVCLRTMTKYGRFCDNDKHYVCADCFPRLNTCPLRCVSEKPAGTRESTFPTRIVMFGIPNDMSDEDQ